MKIVNKKTLTRNRKSMISESDLRKKNGDILSTIVLSDESEEESDVITLHGCGRTTHWRFPQNLKFCPVQNCRIQFGVRSDAINHYRKRHANRSILCPICDKPIVCSSKGDSYDFRKHYNLKHPNEELPHGLNPKAKAKKNYKQDMGTDSETEKDDDEQEDLIELHGCGLTTYWKFPKNVKNCPVHRCRANFGVRSDAIRHYRNYHANRAILCPICVKPILCANRSFFNIKDHYNRVHPNEELPYDFSAKTNLQANGNDRHENSSDSGTGKYGAKEDDLITLHGCGQVTQWKFPKNLKKCPNGRCRAAFDTRTDAIKHYKKQHTQNSILCPVCVKPICVKSRDFVHFKSHYKRLHPKHCLPYNMGSKTNTTLLTVKENNNNNESSCSESEQDDDDDEENDLIRLTGCGQLTQWRFPKDLKRCPVHYCRMQFGVRSDVINHYRKRHAIQAVLCPICVKPILCSIGSLGNIRKHYSNVHPKQKLPYLSCGTSESKVKGTNEEDKTVYSESENAKSDEEENDLITLSGCGQTTYWRFPQDLKHCPVQSCRIQFGVRSDAINHYQKRHAIYSLLCPICVKPICAQRKYDFQTHFAKVHPMEEMPYDLDAKRQVGTKDTNVNMKKSEKSDRESGFGVDIKNGNIEDLITLTGCGYITQWRFPQNQQQCPNNLCRADFESRSEAIVHYQERHADHMILCDICNKPIALGIKAGIQSPVNFTNHYKRMHPNTEISYDFNKIIINTDVQSTIDENINPILNGNQKQFLCPLKDCNFRLGQSDELREHWNSEHSHLRFPEIREESKFTYNADSSGENVELSFPSNLSVVPEPTSSPKSLSSLANARQLEKESSIESKAEPELLLSDAEIDTASIAQEITSNSQEEEEDEVDNSLLQPLRSSESDDNTSCSDSTDETGNQSKENTSNKQILHCTKCNRSFLSVAGFQRHSMIAHNVHSFGSPRKAQKRKQQESSPSESEGSTVSLVIKKEKMSSGSDDENIPILELLKASSKKDLLVDTQCMVVVERTDLTPNQRQAQIIFQTQTEQVEKELTADERSSPPNVVQENEKNAGPLDLSLNKRQATDIDTITVSENARSGTDEAPIVISDDSDDDSDIEIVQSIDGPARQKDHSNANNRTAYDTSLKRYVRIFNKWIPS